MNTRIGILIAFVAVLMPSAAYAHQPRIVEGGSPVEIANPEVSQAFYGELKGAPQEFGITMDRDFRLYVGLLVPDVPGAIKAMSAEVVRVRSAGDQSVALLDGAKYTWTQYYEAFAQDHYFWGPEFSAPDSKKGVALKGRIEPAGMYTVTVFNGRNLGKYTLVVGDEESFPLKEMIHAAIAVATATGTMQVLNDLIPVIEKNSSTVGVSRTYLQFSQIMLSCGDFSSALGLFGKISHETENLPQYADILTSPEANFTAAEFIPFAAAVLALLLGRLLGRWSGLLMVLAAAASFVQCLQLATQVTHTASVTFTFLIVSLNPVG